MHYLLGLAALVMGAVIATRRTRPTWFVVTTSVLVAIGALLAILSYLRVTDPMGFLANSILGWLFVGLSLMTMLSAVFVLERRGSRGEELPPLIGDNPFDGDTDDSDDPAPGTAPGVGRTRRSDARGTAAETRSDAPADSRGEPSGVAAVTGAAAAATAAGAAASGSPGSAGVGAAGTEAFAQEAAGERARADETAPREGEPAHPSRDARDGDAAHPGLVQPDPVQPDPHASASAAATAATPKEADMTMSDPGQMPDDMTTAAEAESPAMEAGLRASLGAGGGAPAAHTDERPSEQEHATSAASDPGPGADETDAEIGEER